MKELVVLVVVLGTQARADNLYGGLMLRTDRNTHSARVSGGVQTGRVALTVVADPLGYQRSGQQSDTDAMVEVDIARGWAISGGWRVSTTPILGRTYWHHKPFVGVAAPLPSLFWGHVRTRFGAELAVSVAKHGDDLPTQGIWDAMSWDRTDNAVDLGFFVRAEIARGL